MIKYPRAYFSAACVVILLVWGCVRWPFSNSDVPLVGSEHRIEKFAYSLSDGDHWISTWHDFPPKSNLIEIPDARLRSLNEIVPIDIIHGEGHLHRGIWIAVVRSRKVVSGFVPEVLLLRRTMDMKTCPGALGFVGEHSNPGEEWGQTASRALIEELGLPGKGYDVIDMTPGRSILVQTLYPELQRRDLQATKLYLVNLSAKQARQITGDSEVAEMIWLPFRNVTALLEADTLVDSFCNRDIGDLAKLTIGLVMAQPSQISRMTGASSTKGAHR